jgi:hypothetical protein
MSAEDERGERLSIPYSPGRHEVDDDAAMRGRAFLFVRDLPLGIMPYRTSDEDDFVVSLEPTNDEVSAWLMRLLDISGHRPWNLEEMLSDFVREVVGSLAYAGELHLEIVPSATEGAQSLPNVELVPLPLGHVMKVANRYVQLVPSYSRAELGRRYVAIPADKIWGLRLPRTLGSPRRHRGMLCRLADVSDVIPDFALSPTMGSDIPGWDFQASRFATDAEVENLTKHWGSIPSLQRIDGTTEFYFFARTLQFRRSEALIRQRIIDDINALLQRLDVQSQLRVSGLPTSEQIAQLIRGLEGGEIDFARAAAESRVP